jgi:membrane protein
MSEPRGRWAAAVEAGRTRSRHALAAVDETVVGRLWARLLEIEFVDRSVALAAKAFVSLFPVLIIAAALSPPAVRESIITAMATRFGFSGTSLDLVREAFASPDQVKTATGLLGLVLTLLYAVSFTTALQRVYLRAWRRPTRGGLRDKRQGLVWLASALALLAVLGSVGRVLVGPPGTVFTLVLGLAGSTLLWWWTAHTLLRSQVRWRPLLPTALATGVGAGLYSTAASIWMPRVLDNNVAQFGFVGVALSFVTWFVGFAFVLVVAAALGPALSSGTGRVAQWLRGEADAVLVDGAPPELPGPASPPRLRDLLRGASADPVGPLDD